MDRYIYEETPNCLLMGIDPRLTIYQVGTVQLAHAPSIPHMAMPGCSKHTGKMV